MPNHLPFIEAARWADPKICGRACSLPLQTREFRNQRLTQLEGLVSWKTFKANDP